MRFSQIIPEFAFGDGEATNRSAEQDCQNRDVAEEPPSAAPGDHRGSNIRTSQWLKLTACTAFCDSAKTELTMKYAEFESWLSDLIEKAPEVRRLAFARDTIGQVLNSFGEKASKDLRLDLSEAACTALLTAMREVLTAPPEVLKGYLAIIYAGQLDGYGNTLDPGEEVGLMDPYLLDVIVSLQDWVDYLNTKNTYYLLHVADQFIAQIDWEVGASLDDFLASPEMRAERDRIAALLAV